ncbi:transglutaminase-like putative cysteine protease [Undibacterium sp. GrIS 1.2]|uniref:transglutaminase family protein n=1 Tax=Undibacterium sp. GrIS 1.2 TaxID=3143933 RepID=UPI0033961165
MKLSIRHETIYRYTAPLAYTIQQLRLTPREELQQHALSWQITTSGQRHAYTDAYGNLSHMLTITGQHDALSIVAQGLVETIYPYQGRLNSIETLSPLIFSVATRLTEPTPQIMDFAAGSFAGNLAGKTFNTHGKTQTQGKTKTPEALKLAELIFGAIEYQSGATLVTTSADDALSLGRGVCQDHAHLFLACCHAHSIPARYVSGYIDPGTSSHAESHAWVDVWVEDSDFSGWVSIDVTHARLMTDAYCRLAVGRDYDSAAPIRGVRRGGGEEMLDVNVQVMPVQQ